VDAEVIDVKQWVVDDGFSWALNRPTREPFEIFTTRDVINARWLLGGEAFSRMLDLIAEAWHGIPQLHQSVHLLWHGSVRQDL
jgi:hypothetical protein